MGNARQAIRWCISALEILRAVGDQHQEGYALRALGASYAALGDGERAQTAFETALERLQASADRHGEAMGRWEFGWFLAHQGDRNRALPLLRAAVAYKQEIGYAQAAEHAALLTQLEAGEITPELSHQAAQRSIEDDEETGAAVPAEM